MASKTMLGCDMSHWDSGRYKSIIPDMDFVIIKATEGKTSKDRYLDILYNFYTSVQDARGIAPEDRCYGFYHYAHPELNKPEEEAEHFLRTIGHHAGKALQRAEPGRGRDPERHHPTGAPAHRGAQTAGNQSPVSCRSLQPCACNKDDRDCCNHQVSPHLCHPPDRVLHDGL